MNIFGWLTKEKPKTEVKTWVKQENPTPVPALSFEQKKDQIIQSFHASIGKMKSEKQVELDAWKKEQETKPKFKCVIVTADEELETDVFEPLGSLFTEDYGRHERRSWRHRNEKENIEDVERQYNPFFVSVYLNLQTSEERAVNFANGQQDIANRHLTMGYFCPKTKQMIPHKEIKKIKLVQVSEE